MQDEFLKKLLYLNLQLSFEQKAWDESKHPRVKPGSDAGGEFTNSVGSNSITEQRKEIEKQLSDRNIQFEYLSYSNTDAGTSIYYNIGGKKARFSDHSVSNYNRLMEEYHFDLPNYAIIGKNGKLERRIYDNAEKYKKYFNK